MNKNSLPLFIGVFVSLLILWQLNNFIIVDQCLDQGGSFQYKLRQYLLADGQLVEIQLADLVVAAYFFIAIIVAVLVSFTIRKIFKIAQ